MAVTKKYKVYGAEGHRQRESFCDSYTYNFSTDNSTRIIQVINSDVTHTNDYSIVVITRDTESECLDELESQISDGIFENSTVGKAIEFSIADIWKYRLLDNAIISHDIFNNLKSDKYVKDIDLMGDSSKYTDKQWYSVTFIDESRIDVFYQE